MPELKNTFLEGKMNKDLDARLLKNGEYVNAENIHITKSEGSDVGTVQNILGNKLPYTTAVDRGTVIGYFADSEKSKNILNEDIFRIFYFVKGNSNHVDNIYYYEAGATTAPIPLIKNNNNFLNFNSDFLIIGVNLIDNLLFWTDGLNQPRKINIETALDNTYRTGTSARTNWYKPVANYYDNEDKISVVKYYPYTPPKVLRQVGGTDHGGMQLLKTKADLGALANSKSLSINASTDTNHEIHVGQEIYDGTTFLGKVEAVSADGLTVTSDTVINKNSGTTLTFLNQNDKLDEKFVRFAYRFKYKDGEYSLISPFTQHCFIPKTYNSTYTDHDSQGRGLTAAQETEAAESTELASFTNDVSHVNLQIDFPSASPTTDFEIDKIEILIKESNRPDIRSLAQLNITDSSVGNNKIYEYTYKGSLPYKTLPEQQLTRVYDNVPVKAKAQEIIGNRLVYGNYQENPYNKPFQKIIDNSGNDLSYSFDYQISLSDKNDPNQKFHIQYPYHTIKTRRTYQVGVVLADKYGRQSPVFLSDDVEKSIIKVKAKSSNESPTVFNGELLEITFNKQIPSSDIDGNSVLHSSTNPTGWYSYKIVVKQNEQDYYNVYAPSAKDGIPNARVQHSHSGLYYTDADKRTWLVLHGDNINKVPRDTTQQAEDGSSIFPSDVSLFPKVFDDGDTATDIMSDAPLVAVTSIGKAMDHGLQLFDEQQSGADEEKDHTYLIFHNWKKNPLLAEMPDGFGQTITMSNPSSNPADQSPLDIISPIGFSVWETKPVESALDLYYETLTCGLISELNSQISSGASTAQITSIKFSDNSVTANLPEGQAANTVVGSTHFQSFDQDGNQIANSGITYSVISVIKNNTTPPLDTTGNLYFGIQDAGNNQQQLKTTSTFAYFGTSSDTYKVRIKAAETSNASNNTEQDFLISITNSQPTVVIPATANHAHFNSSGIIFSPTSAVNGSADTTQNVANITHSIKEVTYDPSGANETTNTHKNKFTINSSTGAVSANNHVFPASEVGKIYRVTVEINDNSGQGNAVSSPDSCDVTIGGWFWGNFRFSTGFNGICPAYCGNTSPQTFYIKRPSSNSSTSLTPQFGDLIFTNAALTTSFNAGYILTQLVGGSDGTGLNVIVSSGAIQQLNNDNLCSNFDCSSP